MSFSRLLPSARSLMADYSEINLKVEMLQSSLEGIRNLAVRCKLSESAAILGEMQLTSCYRLLHRIDYLNEDYRGNQNRTISAFRRYNWAVHGKYEVLSLLEQLESHINSLHIYLNAYTMRILHDQDAIRGQVETAQQQLNDPRITGVAENKGGLSILHESTQKQLVEPEKLDTPLSSGDITHFGRLQAHTHKLNIVDDDVQTAAGGDIITVDHSHMNRYKLITTFADNCTVHIVQSTESKGDGPGVETRTKWRRKRDIGVGGFGVVWLEEEESGGQGGQGGSLRAVKRIPQEVKGFYWSRELEILARLTDDSSRSLFVQFFGWYEDETRGYVFFAMEYIQHGDLSQYLQTFGTRAKSQAKNINILIPSLSPLRIKIADFGLSKHQNNTSLRTACGTLFYLAPELQGFVQRKPSGSYSNLVDIWSLGILTHEVLTLELPFLRRDAPASDSDSQSEVRLEQLEEPEMDMFLFSKYCAGDVTFPDGLLRGANISDEGMEFVKSLLIANPLSRITAAGALESSWLLNAAEEPYPLSRGLGYILTGVSVDPMDAVPSSCTAASIQPNTNNAEVQGDTSSSKKPKAYRLPTVPISPNVDTKPSQSVARLKEIAPPSPAITLHPSTKYKASDIPGATTLGAPFNSLRSTLVPNTDQHLGEQKESRIGEIPSNFSTSEAQKTTPPDEDHTFSFEVLSPGVESVIDIVVIHGLYSTGGRTWVAENGVHWLKDLLSHDCPSARILNYRYDRDAVTRNETNILDLSITFINDLSKLRPVTKTGKRPIVFLAHGLGGIIIKIPLVYANISRMPNQQRFKRIHILTYGILFFGTPHGGQHFPFNLSPTTVPLLLGKEVFSRQMLPHSEFLSAVTADYGTIADQFHTLCFYETKQTPGRLSFVTVVPKDSAIIPGLRTCSEYQEMAVNKNHIDMVRIMSRIMSRDDPFYCQVIGALHSMMDKADCVSERLRLYQESV